MPRDYESESHSGGLPVQAGEANGGKRGQEKRRFRNGKRQQAPQYERDGRSDRRDTVLGLKFLTPSRIKPTRVVRIGPANQSTIAFAGQRESRSPGQVAPRDCALLAARTNRRDGEPCTCPKDAR
ncbi:hypothetical protein M8818_003948 [Zalaria obscura]|uniref:Uncharacterized protein n=1 Tax=Zalaria obscura TaxID=2024903 RepID=A0ACC3SDT5_9PEZI